MDKLGDTNVDIAMDAVVSVREIIETKPRLKFSILTRLLDDFYQIRAARVCCCALWIIGEYCMSLSEVESGIASIKQCLGDLPFYTVSEDGDGQDTSKTVQQVNSTTVSSRRPAILADGTYATQSAALETAMPTPTLVHGSLSSVGNLRSLILSGDFFLGAVVAGTLTKLILRLEEVQTSKVEVNKANTQALLIMVSMLQLGQSSVFPHPIDNDSHERIVLCIRILCNTCDEITKIWLNSGRQSFLKMLADKKDREIDDFIDFHRLKSRKDMSQFVVTYTRQLTQSSDPVSAEAHITMRYYNIVLDVTVNNRTSETLRNLCLEFKTKGGLELVECPQNYTLPPESSQQIKANFKVSSTEIGVIFGNIVYVTSSNVLDKKVIVLTEIHTDIDIVDYISPASCADGAFRTMWTEFEWENKVAVNMVLHNARQFLDHMIESTNIKCLTSRSALEGECDFLAANLYAKSVYGEDVLVNVSIEKEADGRFSEYFRIKSKTEGIGKRLADKIEAMSLDYSHGKLSEHDAFMFEKSIMDDHIRVMDREENEDPYLMTLFDVDNHKRELGFMAYFMPLVIENCHKLLSDIQTALEQTPPDFKQAQFCAHNMMGYSANAGALRLRKLSAVLKTFLVSRDHGGSVHCLQLIKDEFTLFEKNVKYRLELAKKTKVEAKVEAADDIG